MPSPKKPIRSRLRKKSESPGRCVHSLGQKFLEESWKIFPAWGSAVGIEKYNGALGANTPASYKAYQKLVEDTLAEVEALPDHQLHQDDWLDRRGLLAMLRTQRLFGGPLACWRTNPQIHPDSAVESIFELVVRNADHLASAVPWIESRLKQIPAYLRGGLECIWKPVPLWTKLAKQSCAGASEFIRELTTTLTPLSGNSRRCAKLCQEAAEAFEEYARQVGKKSPGASNGYAIGKDAFELLVRERTGLRYTADEILALGYSLIEMYREEVATEAAKFGKGSPSNVIEKLRGGWEPGSDDLLSAYREATSLMRDRMVECDLVSLPKGELLKVLPVPAFLKHHFPTAAYSQPPAFSKKQHGIFWVNDLSQDAADEKTRRAEIAQHFGLELTCAHEGYPGHHLQFFIQNRHASKIRRVFHHAIFYEGWTLWCEKLCIDEGLYRQPYAKLIQLHDTLWRACRIVIDCGIQTGKLSLVQARDLLVREVGFTEKRAETDLNWYTSSPTVPMSYLLGRLELERLYEQKVRLRGWGLRQFNDWILSFGAIPWSWIWESELRRS